MFLIQLGEDSKSYVVFGKDHKNEKKQTVFPRAFSQSEDTQTKKPIVAEPRSPVLAFLQLLLALNHTKGDHHPDS